MSRPLRTRVIEAIATADLQPEGFDLGHTAEVMGYGAMADAALAVIGPHVAARVRALADEWQDWRTWEGAAGHRLRQALDGPSPELRLTEDETLERRRALGNALADAFHARIDGDYLLGGGGWGTDGWTEDIPHDQARISDLVRWAVGAVMASDSVALTDSVQPTGTTERLE